MHSSNGLVKAAANGWQINGVMTNHTAFPWTPVTWNFQTSPLVTGANVVGPTRPLAYYGGAGSSCSNSALESGSNFTKDGTAYFNITAPTSVNAPAYTPGIGRNSFRGPCYFDTDMSFAKDIALDRFDRHTLLRLQLNDYNIFNILQLQPITNGNADGNAIITSAIFGESQSANAGRVLEVSPAFSSEFN